MFIVYIFILLLIMTLVSFVVKRAAHKIATVESVIILFLTAIYAYLRFYSYTGGMMSVASFPIDTSIGISFLVGVTPVSLALLFLTTVIMAMAIFVSGRESYDRRFYGLMMATEAGLYGLLISRNFLFFYVFWEAIIIPVFLLIALFGGKNRSDSHKERDSYGCVNGE